MYQNGTEEVGRKEREIRRKSVGDGR